MILKPLLRATGALGLFGAGCLAYGVAVEAKAFRLREVSVPILPAGRKPVRILHISDLHLMASQKDKIAWIRSLAEWKPDFIANTGDNLADPTGLNALAHTLRPLAGIPGVFVFGSNDFHGPTPINPLAYLTEARRSRSHPSLPTNALRLVLEGFGWKDAEQARHRFVLGDTAVEIRGCSDAHIDTDDYPSVMGPMAPGVDLLMGITHAPYQRVLDQMAEDQVRLILAGHTHGGQVCLPGGHALTTNCDLPLDQAKGLSRWEHDGNSPYLHVCAGLGTSPFAPYRFFCPPEATLLTLTVPH